MSLKFYRYKKCGSCQKAQKYFEENGIDYKPLEIRETPPTKTELKKMLKNYEGNIKKLFNTSGLDYRSMNIKDKLAQMSQEEAIELLSQNGNLVKRPFLISKEVLQVGFKKETYEELF